LIVDSAAQLIFRWRCLGWCWNLREPRD
jgi:hypothetical protein